MKSNLKTKVTLLSATALTVASVAFTTTKLYDAVKCTAPKDVSSKVDPCIAKVSLRNGAAFPVYKLIGNSPNKAPSIFNITREFNGAPLIVAHDNYAGKQIDEMQIADTARVYLWDGTVEEFVVYKRIFVPKYLEDGFSIYGDPDALYLQTCFFNDQSISLKLIKMHRLEENNINHRK